MGRVGLEIALLARESSCTVGKEKITEPSFSLSCLCVVFFTINNHHNQNQEKTVATFLRRFVSPPVTFPAMKFPQHLDTEALLWSDTLTHTHTHTHTTKTLTGWEPASLLDVIWSAMLICRICLLSKNCLLLLLTIHLILFEHANEGVRNNTHTHK